MPSLSVRAPAEVPLPKPDVHARSLQYQAMITTGGSDIGELELDTHENMRSVKLRLRRAAGRLGKSLDIWDHEGRVYFGLTSL